MIIKIDKHEVSAEELSEIEKAVRKGEREVPNVEVLVNSKCNGEILMPFRDAPTTLTCLTDYSGKTGFNLLEWIGYGKVIGQGTISLARLQGKLSNGKMGHVVLKTATSTITDYHLNKELERRTKEKNVLREKRITYHEEWIQEINRIFSDFINFRYGTDVVFALDRNSQLYFRERWKKPEDFGAESNLVVATLSLQVCSDRHNGPRIFHTIDKKIIYTYN